MHKTHQRKDAKFVYRSGNNVPPKKRHNRKRRDWNQIIRRVCAAAFCVELMIALFANPYLRVNKVRIDGLQTLSADAVFAEAKVPAHQNIFWMALREPFARRLSSDPVIEHVSRSIKLPDTLILKITERQPFAALAAADGYWLLDKGGVPYRELSVAPAGMPVIQATAPGLNIVPGQAIKADWLQQSYQLLALLPDKNNLGVIKVKVDQNSNLCLNRGDNLQIRLGQPDSLPEKIALVQKALAANGGQIAREAAYIDVSYPEQPVWMPRKSGKSIAISNGAELNGNKYATNTAQ